MSLQAKKEQFFENQKQLFQLLRENGLLPEAISMVLSLMVTDEQMDELTDWVEAHPDAVSTQTVLNRAVRIYSVHLKRYDKN
jgi:hypothetical protein